MRLINVTNFTLAEFFGENIPPYAILSHRWQEDELTFQDIEAGTQTKRLGYGKVRDACRVAADHGFGWLWSDTCCIDKHNSVELNENIISMYRFYEKSGICIAYLSDHIEGVSNLAGSSWFQRCWTLQELIAPSNLHIYDSEWCHVGTKREMSDSIAEITGIPTAILLGQRKPSDYSVAQCLSWAAKRKATRIEDEAYSLLGLFDVHMPTTYGIEKKAFRALQELLAQKHDQSLFAWSQPNKCDRKLQGLLADSLSAFASCGNTISCKAPVGSIGPMGNGIVLEAESVPYAPGIYACFLHSCSKPGHRDVIFLQQLDCPQLYARVMLSHPTDSLRLPGPLEAGRGEFRSNKKRKFNVYHDIRDEPLKIASCIEISGIDEFTDLVAISRTGDTLDTTGSSITLALPENSWGTVGVLLFPIRKRRYRDANIACLCFGFDADFSLHLRFSVHAWTMENIVLEYSAMLKGTHEEQLTKMVHGGWVYGYDKDLIFDEGKEPTSRGSILRAFGEGFDHAQADVSGPGMNLDKPFYDVGVRGQLEQWSEGWKAWKVDIFPRGESTMDDIIERGMDWIETKLDAVFSVRDW